MTHEVSKAEAVAAIGNFLSNHVSSIEAANVKVIPKSGGVKLFKQFGFDGKNIKPGTPLAELLTSNGVQGLFVADAPRLVDKKKIDLALILIPVPMRRKLKGSKLLVLRSDVTPQALEEGSNKIDSCRYQKCWITNPNNCDCVSALMFAKVCPANECTNASDCCSGGGSNFDDMFGDVLEVLGN